MPSVGEFGVCQWLREVSRKFKIGKSYERRRLTALRRRNNTQKGTRLHSKDVVPEFFKHLREILQQHDIILNFKTQMESLKALEYTCQSLIDDKDRDTIEFETNDRLEHLHPGDVVYEERDKAKKEKQTNDARHVELTAQHDKATWLYRVSWDKLYSLTQKYADACFTVAFKEAWACDICNCSDLRAGKDIDDLVRENVRSIREAKRRLLLLRKSHRAAKRHENGSSFPYLTWRLALGASSSKVALREKIQEADRELSSLEISLSHREERRREFEYGFLEAARASSWNKTDDKTDQSPRQDKGQTAETIEQHNQPSEAAIGGPSPPSDNHANNEPYDSNVNETSLEKLLQSYEEAEEHLERLQSEISEWHKFFRTHEDLFIMTFTEASTASLNYLCQLNCKPFVDGIEFAEEQLATIGALITKAGGKLPSFGDKSRGQSPMGSGRRDNSGTSGRVQTEHTGSLDSLRSRGIGRKKVNRYRMGTVPGRPSSRYSPRSAAGQYMSDLRGESVERQSPSATPSPRRDTRRNEYKRQQEELRRKIKTPAKNDE